MENLFLLGRIFYGVSIAGMGLQTICLRDFPYFILPPNHTQIPGLAVMAIVFGLLLFLTGASIVLGKGARQFGLLSGGVLLVIFCFYHVPYQLFVSKDYMHLGDWENAAKELNLAAGVFMLAGCFPKKDTNPVMRFLTNLIPLGIFFFAVPVISYGILHFLHAKDVANYVPAWVPYRLFWAYFCGGALLGSGIAIILKIKTKLAATLLGVMIFTWFISLHIPRVIASPRADLPDEITSAFLALAYSGIALAIAGSVKKQLHP